MEDNQLVLDRMLQRYEELVIERDRVAQELKTSQKKIAEQAKTIDEYSHIVRRVGLVDFHRSFDDNSATFYFKANMDDYKYGGFEIFIKDITEIKERLEHLWRKND